MFLPELFLWSLILPHQTQNSFCIHSEPFFWVPPERKGLQSKIFWRARWETLAKLEKQHLLCSQIVVPLCASLAMSAHRTSLLISSTGSFSTREETWPASVFGRWWMSAASKLGQPMGYHTVPCRYSCHAACFTVKLLLLSKWSILPHKDLEASSTEGH